MSGDHKVKVAELPAASTAFTAEPVLEFPVGTSLVLRFEYEEGSVRYRASLQFDGVWAHRHRAEGVCTAWHVKDAYDALVDVRESTWLEELEALSYERGRDPGELHHYLLYVDSAGCYEVVARSWQLSTPEPVR